MHPIRKLHICLPALFALCFASTLTACYTGNFGQWIPGQRPTMMKVAGPQIEISPEVLWSRLVSGYYSDCKISVAQTTTVTWVETAVFRMFEAEGVTFVVYPRSPAAEDFNFIAFKGSLKSKDKIYSDIMSLGRTRSEMKIPEAPREFRNGNIHVEFGGFHLGMNKENAKRRILQNAMLYSRDSHDRSIMEGFLDLVDSHDSIGSRTSHLQIIYGLINSGETDFLQCWTPETAILLAHLGLRGTKSPVVAEGEFSYTP